MPDELHPVMSAINDWIDGDREQDSVFLNDFEQYPQLDLGYDIKNRAFDRLSELKLIPPFQDLKFSNEDIKKLFRVFDGDEFIDINLAEFSEIEDFLERYKDIEKYPNVYDNRTLLAEIITKEDSSVEDNYVEDNNENEFDDGEPRFPLPLEDRGKSKWSRS